MFLETFRGELMVLLWGMAPISEIRGAIPMGIFVYEFSFLKAYVIGAIGNIFPIIFLLLFLEHFSEFLMKKSRWIKNVLNWLFEYTQKRHGKRFKDKLILVALFIFVAIPFPLTGAWSGGLAAFVFGIPFKRAIGAIALGILTSGAIILSLISVGGVAANFIVR